MIIIKANEVPSVQGGGGLTSIGKSARKKWYDKIHYRSTNNEKIVVVAYGRNGGFKWRDEVSPTIPNQMLEIHKKMYKAKNDYDDIDHFEMDKEIVPTLDSFMIGPKNAKELKKAIAMVESGLEKIKQCLSNDQ
jgi:hypothetical protein